MRLWIWGWWGRIMRYDLCEKLNDGTASLMRSRHLISHTNGTTWCGRQFPYAKMRYHENSFGGLCPVLRNTDECCENDPTGVCLHVKTYILTTRPLLISYLDLGGPRAFWQRSPFGKNQMPQNCSTINCWISISYVWLLYTSTGTNYVAFSAK